MKASERSRPTTALSLTLLLASLITLHLGGFIQFDDTSGFGSDRWVMPWGAVAGVLALGAVGVGLSDRAARRAVGGALAALVVALVAHSIANDGFRFIWGGGEGELFYLQVSLGLAALFLLTPTFLETRPAKDETPRSGRSLTGWARFTLYVSALTLGMFVAFTVGVARFEASRCSGPGFDGECDVAVLEGLLWAGGTCVLGLIMIVLAEAARSRRQRAVLDGSFSL